MKPPVKITKLDLLHVATGHPLKVCGTGVHRNWKQRPKGGRRGQLLKALKEC